MTESVVSGKWCRYCLTWVPWLEVLDDGQGPYHRVAGDTATTHGLAETCSLPPVYKPRRFIAADYERAAAMIPAAVPDELGNMLTQAAQDAQRLQAAQSKGTARRKALRQLNAAYVALTAEYARLHAELDTVRRQRDELYQTVRTTAPARPPAGPFARWYW